MLRKVLIALVVLALIAGGVVAYLWYQATALPDWYAAPTSESAASAPAVVDQGWVAADDGEGQQMRNFHMRTQKIKPALRKAIKGSRATVKDGKVEAGLVANVGDVPEQELSANDRTFLKKATDAFPSLKERDVYIGVEGDTVIKDGKVQLGDNSKVRIGNLTYSLPDAAARLGMDEAKLRAELNAELAKMGVNAPK
ncbi:MAG: hypothetical protein R3A79_12390 [Nannocystaceae bacterium]